MAHQPDLFPPPSPAPPDEHAPFDDWDYARMVPRPDWKIPPELALCVDDPEWVPVTRWG